MLHPHGARHGGGHLVSGGLWAGGHWTTGEAGLPWSVVGAQRTPGLHVMWVLCWSASGSVPSSGKWGHDSPSSSLRGCKPSMASKGPSLHPLWLSGEVAVMVKSVTPPHFVWISPPPAPPPSRSPFLLSVFSHWEPPGPSLVRKSVCGSVGLEPLLWAPARAPVSTAVSCEDIALSPHTPRRCHTTNTLEALPGSPWLYQAPGGKGAPC